jgi:hypothetical protein
MRCPQYYVIGIGGVESRVESAGAQRQPVFLVLGGVPLKLYGAAAFSSAIGLGPVLLWTGFARLVRIAPTFLTVAVIRGLFRRRIGARPGLWLAGLLLFWVAFYAVYFARMSHLAKPAFP